MTQKIHPQDASDIRAMSKHALEEWAIHALPILSAAVSVLDASDGMKVFDIVTGERFGEMDQALLNLSNAWEDAEPEGFSEIVLEQITLTPQ